MKLITEINADDTAIVRAEKIIQHAFCNLGMTAEMRAIWTLETARIVEAYMVLDAGRAALEEGGGE